MFILIVRILNNSYYCFIINVTKYDNFIVIFTIFTINSNNISFYFSIFYYSCKFKLHKYIKI